MKAPDKLYVGRRNYGPLIGGWESQPFTSKEIESIEYIRKDALMEWAKSVLKCQEDELAKYDGPSYMKASTMGRIDAYKVLIAKLNSM